MILLNSGRPLELLQKSIGSQILVELKGRKKLKGRLRGYDQHLNLILDNAEEINIDPESNTELTESIDTVIVRGDNIILISPPSTETAKE